MLKELAVTGKGMSSPVKVFNRNAFSPKISEIWRGPSHRLSNFWCCPSAHALCPSRERGQKYERLSPLLSYQTNAWPPPDAWQSCQLCCLFFLPNITVETTWPLHCYRSPDTIAWTARLEFSVVWEKWDQVHIPNGMVMFQWLTYISYGLPKGRT